MSLLDAITCILVFWGAALVIGQYFIEIVFHRKQELINRMTEKGDF